MPLTVSHQVLLFRFIFSFALVKFSLLFIFAFICAPFFLCLFFSGSMYLFIKLHLLFFFSIAAFWASSCGCRIFFFLNQMAGHRKINKYHNTTIQAKKKTKTENSLRHALKQKYNILNKSTYIQTLDDVVRFFVWLFLFCFTRLVLFKNHTNFFYSSSLNMFTQQQIWSFLLFISQLK